MMGWVEHVACMGETRDAHRVLVRKPKRKDHLEVRCRWDNVI
jgi:hypothetical protein